MIEMMRLVLNKITKLFAGWQSAFTGGFSVGLKPGEGSLGLVESGNARGPLLPKRIALPAKQSEPRLQVSARWGTSTTTVKNLKYFLRGGFDGKGGVISLEVASTLRFLHTISMLMLMVCFLTHRPVLAKLESGMKSDVVIGQQNFDSSVVGVSDKLFSNPRGLSANGEKICVADFNSDRILIYNQVPTSNFSAADVVVGQSNFTDNANSLTRTGMTNPEGCYLDEQRLIVSDSNANRVLIFNSIPTENGAPADVVVGKSNFTTGGGVTSQTGMRGPTTALTVNGKLIVADELNHRILIYSKIPTQNGAPADIVLGQPDFVTANGGVSRRIMNEPKGIASDGTNLIIADTRNNRILIFNKFPTESFAPADVVIGQPDFVTNTNGTSRTKLRSPRRVSYDGQKIYIPDTGNNRVLIYNAVPSSNLAPADIVLGQPDFNSRTAAVSQNHIRDPLDVVSDGRHLLVVERTGNRVSIFNLLEGGAIELGPQFSQGKAVVGKVFWDWNGNGRQDGGIS